MNKIVSHYLNSFFFFLSFFLPSLGQYLDLISGLCVARQALYHLNQVSSPEFFFLMKSSFITSLPENKMQGGRKVKVQGTRVAFFSSCRICF
jgi:hypothetical protein